MGSDTLPPVLQKVNTSQDTSTKRSCLQNKNQGKVPKRARKAEREKMKRQHLNDLFLSLSNALEHCEQSNGKASILREATRLLKDLFCQIESMREDTESLLSETHHMTMEKYEMIEENSIIKAQIWKLQDEIKARVAKSRPDLNVIPHLQLQQQEKITKFPEDSVELTTLQQGHAVFVVPLTHNDQDALSAHNVTDMTPKPTSTICKPHARYPTPMDSWPLQLLAEQPTSR